MRWLGWAMAGALILAQSAMAGAMGSAYAPSGQCGPFPKVHVTAPVGACVGLVAGPEQGLRMPRTIVEWRPGEFVVADMAGWGRKDGRLLGLSLAAGGAAAVRTIASNLHQPHGLAKGPDGRIYAGVVGAVLRFDPKAPSPGLETVVDNLPTDGLHPLTNLVFAKDGSLIVNVGAPTDRCAGKGGKPAVPCPEGEGGRARAALWRLVFDAPGGKIVRTEVLARGLRNSMALAVDPASGALIQAENGVDLSEEELPPEEINIVAPGRHYGWPGCFGAGDPLPGSGLTKSDCAGYEPAAALLPAHSAPLGMVLYEGAMLPALRGKLLIALHGYRRHGRRVVAVPLAAVLAAQGRMAALEPVVTGWERERGVRPRGSPAGLAVAADGSVWFVDDKNRTVMTLRAGGGTQPPGTARAPAAPPPPVPQGWAPFAAAVLRPKCAACHTQMGKASPDAIWAAIVAEGWAGEGPLKDTGLVRAMAGEGPEKPMPPPKGLKADPKAMQALKALLEANP